MWAANTTGDATNNAGVAVDAATLVCQQDVYSGADVANVITAAGDIIASGDVLATGSVGGDVTAPNAASLPAGLAVEDGRVVVRLEEDVQLAAGETLDVRLV